MTRNFAVVAGVLLLIGSAMSAVESSLPNGTIWVTERTSGNSTVAAIDAATGTPRGIVAVGNTPIGITAPRGLKKVYSSDEGANQLSVIDKDSVTVLTTIPMGPGSRPHHLMASRNGHTIYVAKYGTNRVGLVDTQRDENICDLTASNNVAAKTHAVWISRNGRDLYATNEGAAQGDPGTLSQIDLRDGCDAAGRPPVWEITVGRRPSEVLVFDGIAYVSVRNDHVVRAYDVSAGTPAAALWEAEAQFSPDTLSITNDGQTLIVGLRGTPARMAFIDTDSHATQYLALPGTTTGHQWLSRNGRFTYIAIERNATPPGQTGAIGVVDNRLRSVVAVYPYPNGRLQPHGVFFEPPDQEDEQ